MIKLLLSTSLLFCSHLLLAGNPLSDTITIRQHLQALTQTNRYRNAADTQALNHTAAYIISLFRKYADSVYIQRYTVNGMEYKNVIASFGIANARRIIVGAHYDVCGNQQGADDNASGVTGLLELARLLSHQPLKKRIDLVAYTLEEPPYFRTEQMGSYVHAKSLLDIKDQVEGMVCLEMIGYFKDQEDSQQYPVDALKAMYGTKGDFITLVQKSANSPFAKQFARQYKNTGVIKTEEFVGPVTMPGIDFSDHLNYWNFGFGALMITDTSFYRNKNYHQQGDTIDKLDLNRMSKVIDGVYLTLTAF